MRWRVPSEGYWASPHADCMVERRMEITPVRLAPQERHALDGVPVAGDHGGWGGGRRLGRRAQGEACRGFEFGCEEDQIHDG